MIDDIKPNETWHISPKEAEEATIEKCAHLHVSLRIATNDGIGAPTSHWECDAGCGTRFIPVEVKDISFIEYFQEELGGTGGKP